jgi:hypothetical protein
VQLQCGRRKSIEELKYYVSIILEYTVVGRCIGNFGH